MTEPNQDEVERPWQEVRDADGKLLGKHRPYEAPQPTGGENERLAKWGDQILDNFNDAVVRLSLTVADEKEWAKRYEKLKAETLSAFDDSIVRPTLAAERTLSYNKGYEDAKKECANDRKVS